jgi:hypothetical protein
MRHVVDTFSCPNALDWSVFLWRTMQKRHSQTCAQTRDFSSDVLTLLFKSLLVIYTKKNITFPNKYYRCRDPYPKALLPPRNDLRNSVPDNRTRLLRFLPRQTTRNTHLERRKWLPTCIPRVDAETKREGFEAGN